jgi:hypothetical protein
MIELESAIQFFDATPRGKYKKVLSYGHSKTGKTFLGGTFPKPFVIDTDHSLSGLTDPHIPAIIISHEEVRNGTLKLYDFLYDIIRSLRDKQGPFATKFPDIETLMIDGVSTLADLLLIETMLDVRIGKTVRNPISEKATFDEYGALGNRLEALFTIIDDLPLNLYVTAGIKQDKDEADGILISMPDIVGSFRKQVSYRFDAVLHTFAEKGKYYVHCVPPSYKTPCGVRRWCGPTQIENPTFEKIFNEKNFLPLVKKEEK